MTPPAVHAEKELYLESYGRLVGALSGNGRGWLRPLREEAIARFAELGFPTTRDEDWRFTNVESIATTPFQVERGGRGEVQARDLARFAIAGTEAHLLVFVNGRYAEGLSRPGRLPASVRLGSLADACARERDRVEPHLGRYADLRRDAFTALNTAFLDDGAFVRLPKGAVLEEPIHLLYLSTPTAEPIVTHPRNLIVAEESAQAVIIEHYVALGDALYFSNAVTELVAGENAVLTHVLIEQESNRAFNVSTLRIQQGRSSNVASHTLLLGGALVRNNVHPVLAGEGCDCLINGLFMGTDQQHMDNTMRVEHASPHGDSRQFYNGILDEGSRGVFQGRIIVHPGAQKTDAKQTNRNLLLSQEARVDTKPQLEIYADDVKCTHGATIGQLEEDAVFYLRSRGIPDEEARGILMFGFARENLERIASEPIRKHLEARVAGWFARRRSRNA